MEPNGIPDIISAKRHFGLVRLLIRYEDGAIRVFDLRPGDDSDEARFLRTLFDKMKAEGRFSDV